MASAANRAPGRASAHLRALLPSQSHPLPSEMLRMEAANCPKTTAFSPGLWAACRALFILLHSGFMLCASGSCHWWHRAHQTHYNYANLNYANLKPETQREELPSPKQASCPPQLSKSLCSPRGSDPQSSAFPSVWRPLHISFPAPSSEGGRQLGNGFVAVVWVGIEPPRSRQPDRRACEAAL